MKIGIVGAEGAKFTSEAEVRAKTLIRKILTESSATAIVSGACHLGGVDVWAEEIGRELGLEPLIFPPKTRSWESGFKPRNIQIAETADVVHNIVLDVLPPGWTGMRFSSCYHCKSTAHVKSGGCWTAKYAERQLGKAAFWHVVTQITPVVEAN